MKDAILAVLLFSIGIGALATILIFADQIEGVAQDEAEFEAVPFTWEIVQPPDWGEKWVHLKHSDGRRTLTRIRSINSFEFYPPEWAEPLGMPGAALVFNVVGKSQRLDLVDAKQAEELFEGFLKDPELSPPLDDDELPPVPKDVEK